jgi:hypothetical protein
MGRAKSACALLGMSSSACTCGHMIGPARENAYAVEPVGVEQQHAVAAERRHRPAVDLQHHLEDALRLCFSTDTSLSAQLRAISSPPTNATASTVIRSSTS